MIEKIFNWFCIIACIFAMGYVVIPSLVSIAKIEMYNGYTMDGAGKANHLRLMAKHGPVNTCFIKWREGHWMYKNERGQWCRFE